MRRRIGLVGAMALGLGLLTGGPANAEPASTPGTIYVPDDFVATRRTRGRPGTTSVEGTVCACGPRAATRTDKVAEYVATDTPLASVGEPTLDFTNTRVAVCRASSLVVDFDADGQRRRHPHRGARVVRQRLVAATTAPSSSSRTVRPNTGGGSGQSTGTAPSTEWRPVPGRRTSSPSASPWAPALRATASNAINFAGTRYTFAEHVVLDSKEQCKNGGWATSTKPVYKNQGECVSSFATAKAKDKD